MRSTATSPASPRTGPTTRSPSTMPLLRVSRPLWCLRPTRTRCLGADPVDCSRSHDQEGEGDRTASVEEGVGLPSAGPRGERILPVQVDHRGRPSSAQSGGAGDRGHPGMQYPQSDDSAWQACVVRRWAMTGLWVGIFTGWLRFMHQRRVRGKSARARTIKPAQS